MPAPPAEIAATDKDLPRDFVLEIEAREGRIEATSYWGSKQLDHLTAMPYGLDKTVQLGMFGFLARPLLYSLQWIYANVVANYGWAIVLLTVALKIVLLPLSISAFKSMRKMQKLNPKMQAVRERWKGKLRDKNGRFNSDAQKQMNEEIMGLYRSEGVNPAGGCFPMLIQLPVFFAFYSLLSSAVELWRSPWIGLDPRPHRLGPLLRPADRHGPVADRPATDDPGAARSGAEAPDAVPAGGLHDLLARFRQRPGALLADQQRPDDRAAEALQLGQGP